MPRGLRILRNALPMIDKHHTETTRITPDPTVHDFAAVSACSAAAAGVPVIPLRPGTKRPLGVTGDGHLDGALRDPQCVLDRTAEIMAERRGHRPGWGIVTGGRLVVLDLDAHTAERRLERLGEEHPEVAAWIAATIRVKTARGLHLYGAVPTGTTIPSSAGRLAEGLDVRGRGGYVVAPGTRHPSGSWYELDTNVEANAEAAADDPGAIRSLFHVMDGEGDDFTVASVAALTVPDALLGLLAVEPEEKAQHAPEAAQTPEKLPDDTEVARRLKGLVKAVREAPRGQGNATLNWAAGVAAALGADRQESEEKLVEAYLARPTSERPADREREARATIASGWRWGAANPEKALRERAADVSQAWPTEGEDEETEPVTENSETSLEDLTEAFFESRPWLRRLRDFARARRVSPWALLGVVLARAAAAVPPSVVLPPTRGSVASLNTFIAICGPSGSGKSAVTEAALDAFQAEGGVEVLETAPGSGEGLIAAYVYTDTANGKPRQRQTCASVLLEVDEVQALGSLTSRTASTLLPFLKSAWSGKLLATQNADTARRRKVEPHSYRLAITAGVQPANASVILDDAAGGFPQRFLWMPTFDPGMLPRGTEGIEPKPLRWKVPTERPRIEPDGTLVLPGQTIMELPAEAVDAILEAAEAQNRAIGAPAPAGADALDGHALLARAKVAALLALLDGREVEVTADDWTLAGIVMDVSDRTRGEIVAVNAREARVEADRKAARQGRTAAIASDAETETRIVRALAKIRDALADGEEHPVGQVNRKLRRWRDEFAEALDRLVETGEVERVERPNAKGTPTTYLKLAGGAK